MEFGLSPFLNFCNYLLGPVQRILHKNYLAPSLYQIGIIYDPLKNKWKFVLVPQNQTAHW